MSRKTILIIIAFLCIVIALANVRFHEEIEVVPRNPPKDLEENFFDVTDEEVEKAEAALKTLPDTRLLSEFRTEQEDQTGTSEINETKKPNKSEMATPNQPPE